MISQFRAVAHEDATLHLYHKVGATVIKKGKGSCAEIEAYLKMETEHRPSTDDGCYCCLHVKPLFPPTDGTPRGRAGSISR